MSKPLKDKSDLFLAAGEFEDSLAGWNLPKSEKTEEDTSVTVKETEESTGDSYEAGALLSIDLNEQYVIVRVIKDIADMDVLRKESGMRQHYEFATWLEKNGYVQIEELEVYYL
jgi:hypothetical protein